MTRQFMKRRLTLSSLASGLVLVGGCMHASPRAPQARLVQCPPLTVATDADQPPPRPVNLATVHPEPLPGADSDAAKTAPVVQAVVKVMPLDPIPAYLTARAPASAVAATPKAQAVVTPVKATVVPLLPSVPRPASS